MAELSPPPLNFGRLRSTHLGQPAAAKPDEVQHHKDTPKPQPSVPAPIKPPQPQPAAVVKPPASAQVVQPKSHAADEPKKVITAPVRLPVTVKPTAPVTPAPISEVANPLLDPDEVPSNNSEGRPQTAARGSGGKAKRRASRFQMTDEHLEALRWIDKARYSTAEQVAVYLDRANRSTRKLLGKLEGHGYVKRKQFAGFPVAYFLSESAKDLLGSPTRVVNEASGPGFIRHTLSVGDVMLAMLKGGLPVAQALATELGRPLALTDFISESEVERASNRHFGKVMTALEKKARKHDSQAFVRKWEGWKYVGKEAKAISVEDELNEASTFAWAVYGEGIKPHYPDLVLRVPRSTRSNRTLSIAFEIERSMKPASVDDILAAYKEGKESTPRYGQCVWFCGNENVLALVKDKVETAAAGHAVTSLDMVAAWKRGYVTHLEAEARAATEAHKQVRQQGWWHVTSQLSLAACTCGLTCRAKHGRFASRQEAFDLLDEMV